MAVLMVLVILLVIGGGVLMARLLSGAADRSDIWSRWGWPNPRDKNKSQ